MPWITSAHLVVRIALLIITERTLAFRVFTTCSFGIASFIPADASTFDHLYRSRLGNFDVVPEVCGTYDTLVKRAVPMNAWGYDIRVVHIDELLAAVTLPRRPKDVPRVRQLRDIQRRRGEQ